MPFLADIENAGKLRNPSNRLSVCADDDDNKFVECADAANARYIVTGNTKHFATHYRMTKIVTPREFATILLSEGFI